MVTETATATARTITTQTATAPTKRMPRFDGQPPRPIRGRKPGGPNDGGGFGSRVRRAGRALGIGLAALILLALIALFAFGIEIWTDALWFQSVGYSDVYWTRIAAQVGLFVFGLVLALIVLLATCGLPAA